MKTLKDILRPEFIHHILRGMKPPVMLPPQFFVQPVEATRLVTDEEMLMIVFQSSITCAINGGRMTMNFFRRGDRKYYIKAD